MASEFYIEYENLLITHQLMKLHQQKRLKIQAQAIAFCAVLIWMVVSAVAAVPAMAFQPEGTPTILVGYENVSLYDGYAYGSSASGEAIAKKEDGLWKIVCKAGHHLTSSELLNECGVSIGTARHLRVLQKGGMNHEMYVADI